MFEIFLGLRPPLHDKSVQCKATSFCYPHLGIYTVQHFSGCQTFFCCRFPVSFYPSAVLSAPPESQRAHNLACECKKRNAVAVSLHYVKGNRKVEHKTQQQQQKQKFNWMRRQYDKNDRNFFFLFS